MFQSLEISCLFFIERSFMSFIFQNVENDNNFFSCINVLGVLLQQETEWLIKYMMSN